MVQGNELKALVCSDEYWRQRNDECRRQQLHREVAAPRNFGCKPGRDWQPAGPLLGLWWAILGLRCPWCLWSYVLRVSLNNKHRYSYNTLMHQHLCYISPFISDSNFILPFQKRPVVNSPAKLVPPDSPFIHRVRLSWTGTAAFLLISFRHYRSSHATSWKTRVSVLLKLNISVWSVSGVKELPMNFFELNVPACSVLRQKISFIQHSQHKYWNCWTASLQITWNNSPSTLTTQGNGTHLVCFACYIFTFQLYAPYMNIFSIYDQIPFVQFYDFEPKMQVSIW